MFERGKEFERGLAPPLGVTTPLFRGDDGKKLWDKPGMTRLAKDYI
jgi:hypothetical protein